MPKTHSHSGKIYRNLSKKELPNSEVELELEIGSEELAPYYQEALKEVTEHTELPGFRKGHVPEKMIRERFGDLYILEEAVEHALSHAYPEIVAELGLDPVGSPRVTITKLAVGSPAALRIAVPVNPTFALPDYKKIGKGVPAESVEAVADKEMAAAVEEIRKIRQDKEAK